jgi:hypothetical protein
MFEKKALLLSMIAILGCSESEESYSQNSSSMQDAVAEQDTVAEVADSYFEEAETSDTEIVPSQYTIDGQKLAPLSVCGTNGANLRREMSVFERENRNYRPTSDPALRIIQNGFGSFTGLQPGSDIFLARNESMNRALLSAKANIIKTIRQKITAEQAVRTPISGLSIDEKIDMQALSLRNELAELSAETEVLGAEYESLTAAVLTSATSENLQGLTTEDRVNSFFDAAIKKLDDAYDPATSEAEKKAKFEELKAELTVKRASFISSVNKLGDLERDLSNIQNQTISETSVQSLSSMPLYGAATVKHLECYDAEERSIYTMAKVIWTPGLHEQARAILLNEDIDLPPGAKSFDDHIYDLDITQLLGSYRYIDNEGTPWFYSVRSADYTIGNPSTIEDRTNLFAAGQAVLAVYAEVSTSSDAKAAVANSESARTTVTATQFSQQQSQKAQDLNIFGLTNARSEIAISPITGREEYISVAAINMKAAHSAPDAMASLYATLREVNSDQSYRDGLIQAMADEAESTKNDSRARAEGYSDGRNNVQEISDERARNSEPPASVESARNIDAEQEPGRAESSTSFSSQAVEDDF